MSDLPHEDFVEQVRETAWLKIKLWREGKRFQEALADHYGKGAPHPDDYKLPLDMWEHTPDDDEIQSN